MGHLLAPISCPNQLHPEKAADDVIEPVRAEDGLTGCQFGWLRGFAELIEGKRVFGCGGLI